MRRSKLNGSLSVSGPLEGERTALDLQHGLSIAQSLACRHMADEGELTYYVRDLHGNALATVVKDEEGSVLTYVT